MPSKPIVASPDSDRAKLITLFDILDVDVEEAAGSFIAAGRRYWTDEAGKIVKITEKINGERKIYRA